MRAVSMVWSLLLWGVCHHRWGACHHRWGAMAQDTEPDSVVHAAADMEARVWGKSKSAAPTLDPGTHDNYYTSGEESSPAAGATGGDASKNGTRGGVSDETIIGDHIPFVNKPGNPHEVHYEPPEGFRITSRVYTDPDDKLAHFDNEYPVVFPYWECGVAGSTTVPIPLQHVTIRSLLGGSQPNLFGGEEFGHFPHLVIPLSSSVEIVLDSGEVQTFHAGDVVLLEDVVSGGHKLKGHDHQDMTVMILTMTQHYHHVGKDKSCLQSVLGRNLNPCPTGLEFPQSSESTDIGPIQAAGRLLRRLQPRSVRKYVLTAVGVAVSTVLGDYMGKVAPLWLAVAFGGGCFVLGGTYVFVQLGDSILDELEVYQKVRQLHSETPVDDKEDPAKQDQSINEMLDSTTIHQPQPIR